MTWCDAATAAAGGGGGGPVAMAGVKMGSVAATVAPPSSRARAVANCDLFLRGNIFIFYLLVVLVSIHTSTGMIKLISYFVSYLNKLRTYSTVKRTSDRTLQALVLLSSMVGAGVSFPFSKEKSDRFVGSPNHFTMDTVSIFHVVLFRGHQTWMDSAPHVCHQPPARRIVLLHTSFGGRVSPKSLKKHPSIHPSVTHSFGSLPFAIFYSQQRAAPPPSSPARIVHLHVTTRVRGAVRSVSHVQCGIRGHERGRI